MCHQIEVQIRRFRHVQFAQNRTSKEGRKMKGNKFIFLSVGVLLVIVVGRPITLGIVDMTTLGHSGEPPVKTLKGRAIDESEYRALSVTSRSFITDGTETEPYPAGDILAKQRLQAPQKTYPLERYYADGSKYSGDIVNGKRHGLGIYFWPTGHKYMGEWRHSKIHGRGIFIWPNGNKYIGEFKNNRASGGWLYKTNGRKTWAYQDLEGRWIIQEP